jgi:hypothetical protein
MNLHEYNILFITVKITLLKEVNCIFFSVYSGEVDLMLQKEGTSLSDIEDFPLDTL